MNTAAISGDSAAADLLESILDGNVEALGNLTIGVVGDVSATLAVDLTAAGVDAVWDENIVAAHTTADSAGDILQTLQSGDIGGIDVSELNQIVDDWINGGRLDLLLDAIPTTAMRGTDSALTDKAGFALTTADWDVGADRILNRDIDMGASGGRNVSEALQRLRHKVADVAGTVTVFAEDDTTPSWTATLTRAAANAPSVFDPA